MDAIHQHRSMAGDKSTPVLMESEKEITETVENASRSVDSDGVVSTSMIQDGVASTSLHGLEDLEVIEVDIPILGVPLVLARDIDEVTKEENVVTLRPWTYRTITGSIICMLVVALSSPLGMGCGSVLAPTIMLVIGLTPSYAVALSQYTLFAGAISNFIFNAPVKDVKSGYPKINWDIMMIMEPTTICGAIVGSFLNIYLPVWFIKLSLVAVLLLISRRVYNMGVKIELAEDEEDLLSNDIVESENPPNQTPSAELEGLYGDARSYHGKALILTSFFAITCLAIILRGNNDHDNIYWVISFSLIPFCFGFAFLVRRHFLQRQEERIEAGYEYAKGEIVWDETNSLLYPTLCASAGLCAGLFGISGGVVKGPLLMELGVEPVTSSVTSATMVMYTSASTSLAFTVFGIVPWDFVAFFFPIAFVMNSIGKTGLTYMLAQYRNSAWLVFVISGVIGVAAGLMAVDALIEL